MHSYLLTGKEGVRCTRGVECSTKHRAHSTALIAVKVWINRFWATTKMLHNWNIRVIVKCLRDQFDLDSLLSLRKNQLINAFTEMSVGPADSIEEMCKFQKLDFTERYFTASSLLVILKYSCGKPHCIILEKTEALFLNNSRGGYEGMTSPCFRWVLVPRLKPSSKNLKHLNAYKAGVMVERLRKNLTDSRDKDVQKLYPICKMERLHVTSWYKF